MQKFSLRKFAKGVSIYFVNLAKNRIFNMHLIGFQTCNQAGMKISIEKTEVLCLSRTLRYCLVQVSGNTLQQVEKFKYFGVAFVSDGK